LSRIPNRAVLDIPAYLASEFDVIWAIDTNTRQINDNVVSISCVLECYARRVTATQVEISYRKHGYIPFRNCPNGESERYAWSRLVMMITSDPNYSGNLRIAVVTDHDLARHAKYNAGELPICREFYLPSNFRLVYAAGDSGEANVLNRLIIKCDKEANKVLQQLSQKGSFTIGNSTIAIGGTPDLGIDLWLSKLWHNRGHERTAAAMRATGRTGFPQRGDVAAASFDLFLARLNGKGS